MVDHAGHRSRVRAEFLVRGLEGWPDHRVLELLLFYAIPRGDVNGLAHELIERFDTLAGVLDAEPEELKQIKGLGDNTVTLLKLIPALGRLYVEERSSLERIVNGPESAGEYLAPYFYGATTEMVYVLCLDSKGKVLGVRKIAEGLTGTVEIVMRRVVEAAVSLRASGLYLAHNHRSNLALPSLADWDATDSVERVLASIDIRLIDHLVFVDGDMVSLRQSEYGGKRPFYEQLGEDR